MPPIADHPFRYELANELHARPFPHVAEQSVAVFLAIKQPSGSGAEGRAATRAHLIDLLDRHGAAPPKADATHHSSQIGRHTLKWEQHTEFATFTAFREGQAERAFDPVEFEVFPDDWLSQAPGQRVTSAILQIGVFPGEARVSEALSDWFVPESLAVATVLDGAAVIAGDFRVDPAGHMRFAAFVREGTGPRRVGRIVQRLCEVETYKAMSMLGLFRARQMSSAIGAAEERLTTLMAQVAEGTRPPEDTLGDLLTAAAEVETMAATSAFRFGATEAYQAIVNQRIAVLRETRFMGRQTFSEFMMRRFEPAMRTVTATQGRLAALSDRANRTGDLLRTRVDVDRSAQNQALLQSMDRRADLQLRLQHTVEGLSVVAISYYAVSLVSYLLYPAAQALGTSKGTMTAAITLPVVGAVWWMVRRVRKRLG